MNWKAHIFCSSTVDRVAEIMPKLVMPAYQNLGLNAAFTLNTFDDQERNFSFANTDF